MSAPKFRIAIVGGGIGGLALAVTIGKYSDVSIDIYEAGSEITTVGAGVTFWRRTWEIMKTVGLEKELATKVIEPPSEKGGPAMVTRRSDQPEPGVDLFQISLPYGSISIHRADMVGILQRNLPPSCTIHTSKKLTHYQKEVDGGLTLHFTDGTTATSDVLVGADGVRSATRRTMFESLAKNAERVGGKNVSLSAETLREYANPIWTGTLAYRCLIPTTKLQKLDPGHRACTTGFNYLGKDKHIISYPISQGRLINLVAFYTVPDSEGTVFRDKWVMDAPEQEVIDRYEGWEPEVQTLLRSVEKPSRWAIHALPSLPSYVFENVALLGDAAHAMTTHFGAGAGQAIEDAFILGRLLGHPSTTIEKIPDFLRVYEEIRLPFANNVSKQSRLTGLMYEFNAPGYYDGNRADEEGLKALSESILKQWAWQGPSGGSPGDDWLKAEQRLRTFSH